MFSYTKWIWFAKVRLELLMWTKRLYWYFNLRRTLFTSAVVIICVLAVLPLVTDKNFRYFPCQVPSSAHNPYIFNYDNSGPPPFDKEIVPNIIHFYRTGNDVNRINLIDALCLYSAFRIANPEKIMIHTDDVLAVTSSFKNSPYGKRLMQVPSFKRVIEIQHWPVPKHVFGIEFNSIHRSSHISDVTRLRILRKYGGIFLDKHAFLLRNPKMLRHYEMAVFKNSGSLSNRLIIAHRDARMLDLWLKSYHRYNPYIETHHHTLHLKSLFTKKSTFYHEFENGLQNVNANILNSESGLQIKNYDCFVLFFNSSNIYNSLSDYDHIKFESDFIVNFVEQYFSSI